MGRLQRIDRWTRGIDAQVFGQHRTRHSLLDPVLASLDPDPARRRIRPFQRRLNRQRGKVRRAIRWVDGPKSAKPRGPASYVVRALAATTFYAIGQALYTDHNVFAATGWLILIVAVNLGVVVVSRGAVRRQNYRWAMEAATKEAAHDKKYG